MNEYSYLDKLNKEQYEAATTIDGRLLILAGAGSGKTATLISRVAYMIDNGIDPENILLLTFTNKAAKEMRDRAAKMVGETASKITASTFHSFCANFIRRYAKLVELPNDFTILDSADTKDVMDMARQEFLESQDKKGIEYDLKSFPKTTLLLTLHETAINTCLSLSKIIDLYGKYDFKSEIKEIDKIFTTYKRERALVDYNDLLYYTVQILSNNESIRESLDEQYKYISCDEYQDTNTIQNQILELLTKNYQNLAVVGDDNQSIYGWRSADIKNILNFTDKYPDCKSIILYENYRSSQEILDFANAVMDNAKEGIKKNLKGQFNFKTPFFVETKDNFTESNFVCDKIVDLHAEGIPYHEMAVMVRSARQSNLVEAELMTRGIPTKKFGGIKFLERAAVKDALAFLRIMVNDKDELAWFRITQLYPGIGKGYAKKISRELTNNGRDQLIQLYNKKQFSVYLNDLHAMLKGHEHDGLTDFLTFILNDYYPYVLKERIHNMKNKTSIEMKEMENDSMRDIEEAKLLILMSKNYRSAHSFLADLVLEATVDEDTDEDYVNITTIHSAKGLEYEAVFFLDLIDQITPSCDSSSDEDAEELRVFYVAITRAKKYLYLMCPKKFVLGPMISDAKCTRFMMYNNVFETLNQPMPNYNNSNWHFDYSYFY